MASIGMIKIGGRDRITNIFEFKSAVMFSLKTVCKVNEVFNYQDNQWEVEVRENHNYIVARSRFELSIDNILKRGLELCQQALDLLSITRKGEMQIEAPGDEHIVLFTETNRIILREVSISNLGIGVDSSYEIIDKDGNIVSKPPPPQINWIPAFRFYRLSQGSNDLFEAYRNLFLGLEALLNQICPKTVKEGEKQWLKRALLLVGGNIQLSELMPEGNNNAVEYFLKTQYDAIRCKLFHAKGDRAILPHQDLNPIEVSGAYDSLLSLWRKIAVIYFNIPGGGGVITNQGFKSFMNEAFSDGFTFVASNDKTPPNEKDNEINPLKKDKYIYKNTDYKNNLKGGRVLLTGSLEEPELSKVKVIHRIGVVIKDVLFSIKYIQDGLYVNGVDKFESYQTVRLINTSNPKTFFST
jgi:hypothetical protein